MIWLYVLVHTAFSSLKRQDGAKDCFDRTMSEMAVGRYPDLGPHNSDDVAL